MAALRRTAAEAMDRLRERRPHAPDPGPDRRRAMEAASADTSHELRLVHRYEMDHERSLQKWAALRQLMALEKSGADLPAEPESEPEAASEAEAGPGAPEKHGTTPEASSSCVELASVREATPSGEQADRSEGSPGRPERPTGADPGPEMASRRR